MAQVLCGSLRRHQLSTHAPSSSSSRTPHSHAHPLRRRLGLALLQTLKPRWLLRAASLVGSDHSRRADLLFRLGSHAGFPVVPENLPADEKLPGIDVFICTADPKKEPVVEVMKTVLSAMSLDYPVERLGVYLSDDGAAAVTLYAMKEACGFRFVGNMELKVELYNTETNSTLK